MIHVLIKFYRLLIEIYKSFEDGRDVRRVFLDISKAFHKVWHKGLIYKLKQNGISGNLLDTITDFLNSRKQRVALNGQFSSWTSIEAGVPQGFILGSLLFLIYINDLSDDFITNVKLFADDPSPFSVVHDVNTFANKLNNDLSKINDWATQWKMSSRSKQAQEVIFSRKRQNLNHDSIYFNHNLVQQVPSQKHLRMHLQSVTKIVRLAPPPPLFSVGRKSVCSFLVSTAWHGFFRLDTNWVRGRGDSG